PSLPNGTVGIPYSASITASGNGSFSFGLSSGNLPDGLFLFSNGTISGTPTKAGTFGFLVVATDNQGNSPTQSFSIVIVPAPLTIPGNPPGNMVVGVAVPVDLTASGGTPPYRYSMNCTMPAGLSFSNGVVSGTPTSVGTTTCRETANDSVGNSANKDITFNVI